MDDEKKPDQTLDDCLENVEQLKEENEELKVENQELRESADAFGELAERLSVTLRKEREATEDNPASPADSPTKVK